MLERRDAGQAPCSPAPCDRSAARTGNHNVPMLAGMTRRCARQQRAYLQVVTRNARHRRLERHDLAVGVHDRAVCLDGPLLRGRRRRCVNDDLAQEPGPAGAWQSAGAGSCADQQVMPASSAKPHSRYRTCSTCCRARAHVMWQAGSLEQQAAACAVASWRDARGARTRVATCRSKLLPATKHLFPGLQLTSWFCGVVSRTQMYLPLSQVTFVKVMELCCTPRLWSCTQHGC